MMRQFDIWLADLNPPRGTEPGKVRPVVVVQTDLLNGLHPSTLVCPVTSQCIPDVEILRLHLDTAWSGLDLPSDVMVDQIRAVDNRRMIERVGRLPEHATDALKERLRIVLDL